MNYSVAALQGLFLTAVNQHILQSELRRSSRPPWIDNNVVKLVRKKKALWKHLKRHKDLELFSKFKLLRKQTKRFITSKYSLYLKLLSEDLKINPKKFWWFHSLKSRSRRIPSVVMYKCKSVSDPAEKASLFNEFSSAVFMPNCVDLVGLQNDVVHSDLLMEVSTTASEVQNILAK